MLKLNRQQKKRVTFLDPSEYNLFPLFKEMNTRSGVICQWAVTREKASYENLKDLGVERIVFTPDEPTGNALSKLIEPLRSDIIVSSTWGRADSLPDPIFKVQTFHSLGNKVYYIKPALAKKYDLLLFPSEFHKNLYIKHRVFAKGDPRLKVVGWHRIDCFAHPEMFDKQTICRKFGIDAAKPTVFYAPTWSVYGDHGIFYRWFKEEFEVFRNLCEHIESIGANFIIKFHPLLQKPFMQNKTFWEKFLSVVEEYGHVTVIDALIDEDPQPLLYITDVLITDISSIFADFLPLNRPVVFIDPQLDIWEQTEICASYRAGFVVETPEQLLYAISDSFENPGRFELCRKRVLNKLVSVFDGRTAERGVNEILNLLN